MVYTIHNITNKTLHNNDGGLWKQFLLSVTASLPFFTHGILTNTLTVSVHSGHFAITPADVPLSTTAMILAAAVSGPLYCYTIDRCGRKIGIYIINLVQAASCIPLFLVFAPNDTSTICLHVLAGISSAGIFTVLPIYVREITSDKYRGLTMSLKMIMITTGYLMKLALGLETMVYLIVAMATLQLLSMYFLLESPCYLVMAHKWEAALSHVARIKCLSEDNPSVVAALEQLKNESERATAHGRLYFHRILRNPIWRDVTKIGAVLCTVMALCGSVVFLDQTKILLQLRSERDPDHTLVVYSLFAGSALCFLSVHFLERKYLLASALTVMVLSMGVLAVFTQIDLTVAEHRWLPVAALVVLVIGYGMAWGLPAMIIIEMLNLEIRATVVGAVFACTQLVKLSHLLSHPYIEDHIGIYTMLYIFSFVNLYGAVFAFFRLPDVDNKGIRQIERQLKRVPLLEFKSQIN